MTPGRPRTKLLVVGGLALLLRLAAFAAADRPAGLFHLPDSAEYDRLAWNLVSHGVYSLEDSAPWAPDLTRTPVFPLFVAGCYRLGGHAPALAVVAQVGCAVATVLLVWALGRRFFAAPAALAGAALLALDPASIRLRDPAAVGNPFHLPLSRIAVLPPHLPAHAGLGLVERGGVADRGACGSFCWAPCWRTSPSSRGRRSTTASASRSCRPSRCWRG